MRFGCFCVACTFFLPSVFAQDQLSLFHDLTEARDKDLTGEEKNVLDQLRDAEGTSFVSARVFTFANLTFDEKTRSSGIESVILENVLDGAKLVYELTSESWIGKDEDVYQWKGELIGEKSKLEYTDRELTLFIKSNVVGSKLMVAKQLFTIESLGNGKHALILHDLSKSSRCRQHSKNPRPAESDDDKSQQASGNARPAHRFVAATTRTGPVVINMLVVATRPSLRGRPNFKDVTFPRLIKEINDAFELSEIDLRIDAELLCLPGDDGYTDCDCDGEDDTEEPVPHGLSEFTGAETHSANLVYLIGHQEGHLDDIHGIREEKRSDVVVLITRNLVDGAGWAADMYPNKNTAFAVVQIREADLAYGIAHELGHLLGGRHHESDDETIYPFPNAREYRRDDLRIDNFGTIMSPHGAFRTLTKVFSNQNYLYPHGERQIPVGDEQHDCARAFNDPDSGKRIANIFP